MRGHGWNKDDSQNNSMLKMKTLNDMARKHDGIKWNPGQAKKIR